MDVLKLRQEKAFLGHEFLTWLWYRSDEGGGSLTIPLENRLVGETDVTLWVHDAMAFGHGGTTEKCAVRGGEETSRAQEARAALRAGKKLEQARFGLIVEDREFLFTLVGETFDVVSVKLPKLASEEEDSWEADALLRLGAVQELLDVLDDLYWQFIGVRLSPEWSAAVLPALREWAA